MDLNASCCWKRLLLFSLLFVCVSGQTSGPSFMVTFPAVIESGSEAKLCASLLKPNESLVMNIYLVHGYQSTLLLQEKAEEEFHCCFNFKAPLVGAESVQKIEVELQGESFKMTEERKIMFRSYHPLTFIQTDKPIYIPGQTEPDQTTEPPLPLILEDGAVYEVRTILDSRRRGGKLEYLVDWEGYGPEERSWIPKDDILDPTLIEEFHTSFPNRPAPRTRGRPPRRRAPRPSGAGRGEGGNVTDQPGSSTNPMPRSQSPEY